ncbi:MULTISPECIES: type IV secretion system DNA-binding domain-containing protein [unclassified Aurantimonas]|uniref:type IV secretion system DNA-binding domain-containing protein n=1 Tax=unclassified Aurantimonas TaxID=2638230 RepID=UPI002E18413A|nr:MULTISPECIES: type IV secretion system DNA-binding domain-containing protein [unclassified Aurantimonas]MEC5291921.1 type IV secretion system DNA-binding domain-containing protein [Aurantimonas sp. C2-3-R2]MEC5413007.1 type IV secretion system DNA-binding domain-containing protein [Aurantimonas sp. C2-4-R8]
MIRTHKPYPPYCWGLAAVGVGLVATLVVWWFSFAGTYWRLWNGQILEMRPWPALFCLRPWDVLTCPGIFETAGYPDMMKIYRRQVSVFLPTILGLAALFATWFYRNKPREVYIVDGASIGDLDDLARACELDIKTGGGKGLHWFETLTLSRRREANNIFCLGAPGSGKTQLTMQLCRSALTRGDRLLVYCFKPEMIAEFPRQHDEKGAEVEPIILAPHDSRSWVWDIAADVDGPESARSMADLIINLDTADRHFFSDTSRLIVTMYIAKLHAVSPHNWSFGDLAAQVERPYDDMVRDAEKYYTPAVQLLTAEKRQLDSIRSSVQVALENLRLLAVAWPKKTEKDTRLRLSVRKFINGEYGPRALLFARSGDFPDMSDMWIVLFVSLAQQAAASNTIKASSIRRVWFVLDEFAQLPRIKAISRLMVTGRDRGFPILLGVQGMKQVTETYGSNDFSTWWSAIQTKIIFRTEVGEDTAWLAKNLGETRIMEYRLEKNADGTTDTKGKPREAPSFRMEEFSHVLGVDDFGVNVLVSGIGKDRYLVRAPFYEAVPHPDFRPSYEAADWSAQPKPLVDDLLKAMPDESAKTDVSIGQRAAASSDPEPSPTAAPAPHMSSDVRAAGAPSHDAAPATPATAPSELPAPTEYSAENIEVLKRLTPAKRRSRLFTSDPVEDDSKVSGNDDEPERKAAKGG